MNGKGSGWSRARRTAAICGALVFCAAVAAVAGPKKQPPAKPIDLNRATLTQLEELPGVGPAMAQRILDFRKKSGPFQKVEDLLAVRGISRGRFAKIRPYIVVVPAREEKSSHPSVARRRE